MAESGKRGNEFDELPTSGEEKIAAQADSLIDTGKSIVSTIQINFGL